MFRKIVIWIAGAILMFDVGLLIGIANANDGPHCYDYVCGSWGCYKYEVPCSSEQYLIADQMEQFGAVDTQQATCPVEQYFCIKTGGTRRCYCLPR